MTRFLTIFNKLKQNIEVKNYTKKKVEKLLRVEYRDEMKFFEIIKQARRENIRYIIQSQELLMAI